MRTLQGMHTQINEVVTRLLSLFDDITRKLKEAHDYILKVCTFLPKIYIDKKFGRLFRPNFVSFKLMAN